MHRKKEEHRNANRYISRSCEDCKQCMSIRKTDGDPIRPEVYKELQEKTKDRVLSQSIFFEIDSREWLSLTHWEIDFPGLPTNWSITRWVALENKQIPSSTPTLIPAQTLTNELKELQQQPKMNVGLKYQLNCTYYYNGLHFPR